MNLTRLVLLLLFLLALSVQLQAAPASIYVAVMELHMDENNGTTVYDSSGNGNNGTLTSDSPTPVVIVQEVITDPYQGNDPCTMVPSWTAGQSGQEGDYGIRIPGYRDRITVPNSASLSITGSLRVEAWFKPEGPVVMYGDREGFEYAVSIMGKGKNNGGTHEGYGMYVAENGILHGMIGFTNAGFKDFLSSSNMDGTVLHGQWNHAVLTFDGDKTYGLELNGVVLNIDGGGSLTASDTIRASNRDLYIGDNEWIQLYNGMMWGDVDQVNISTLAACSLEGDISGSDGEPDCFVDLFDFAALALEWLLVVE